MSQGWLIFTACCGTGLIAGLFLDVRALLVGLVVPTLALLAALAVSGYVTAGWIVLPTGWIAQQASYALTLMVARPASYESLLTRVRRMMRSMKSF